MKKTLIILTIGIFGILAQPAMAQQTDANTPNIIEIQWFSYLVWS